MGTRKFRLTEVQTAALRRAYERTNDGLTRTRYQAVRLYGTAYPVAQIAEIPGCSRTSLLDWCRLYRTRGVPGLRDGRVGGHRANLTFDQRATVRAALHQYTPRQHRSRDGHPRRPGLDAARPHACRPGVVWRHVAQSRVLSRPPGRLWLQLPPCPEGLHVALGARCPGLRGPARTELIDVAQDAPATVILAEDAARLYLQATLMRVWAPRGQQVVVAADPGGPSRAAPECDPDGPQAAGTRPRPVAAVQ